jgi:hypothetical protein
MNFKMLANVLRGLFVLIDRINITLFDFALSVYHAEEIK